MVYRHKPEIDPNPAKLASAFAHSKEPSQKEYTSGAYEREMALIDEERRNGHKDPELSAHIRQMLG